MRTNILACALALLFVVPLSAQGGALAASVDLGGGCSPFVVNPQLMITPPVMGTTATLSLGSALPQTAGEAWFSPGEPTLPPVLLGGLCPVFLNVVSAGRFASFVTDGAGQWTQSVQVPLDPALGGAALTFQVVLVNNATPTWPLPYIITNGVQVTLGF